ncbi:unnamed protein product [Rotaria magnacalcarata]|uniref:Calcipressin-2 n=4 Tax=Rotaria magnacalcarata TaxID=392030 RepID=A0A816Y379_9BILA|nr:unnamed protein product [Rotaria magnacalcarata]CAF1293667.1 unnamed protein product [Rotaria magnacalcarata]CAF1907947.1 unnamed protein product [Rotaria magnacalcarata]CAF1965135.1 unnamed protein product [Rotaria magnacalcarata]CAF2154084.1 unnamed protein product [Rotaria magnacalcarata]
MHDFQSLQLDDEDSSKYFINYISEDSDGLADDNNTENEHEHVQSPDNHDDVDESSLPNSVIITPVPQELFTNQEFKDEFEQLFRIYDSQIVVLYLKFFQRVRITFTSSHNALQARLHLHEHPFHGTVFKTYFACPIVFRGANPGTHLRPPEPEKLFLISPPPSPPVGWEQKAEDPPVVDLHLIAVIAQLQPNKPHELLSSDLGSKAPAIVIHTCDDNTETNYIGGGKLIRPTLVQTRRPPQTDEQN